MSVGVGTGALLLHLTVAAHGGGSIGAADFAPAFLVVGLIAGISCLIHLPLAPDAGAEVSGQRRREPAVDRLAIEPDGE